MSQADVLATVALAVSLLIAGWAAMRARRWDRPVVLVSDTQAVGGRGPRVERRLAFFELEVVNFGNQSTQLIEAFWEVVAMVPCCASLQPPAEATSILFPRGTIDTPRPPKRP